MGIDAEDGGRENIFSGSEYKQSQSMCGGNRVKLRTIKMAEEVQRQKSITVCYISRACLHSLPLHHTHILTHGECKKRQHSYASAHKLSSNTSLSLSLSIQRTHCMPHASSQQATHTTICWAHMGCKIPVLEHTNMHSGTLTQTHKIKH